MNIDMVLCSSLGDSAKGKVVHYLLKQGSYQLALRVAGSNNCGHSIYHEGEKFAVHMIPVGVFSNVRSIICVGCVLHPKSFFKELNELQERFNKTPSLSHLNLNELIKIDKNTFIVEDHHIEEDCNTDKIGSTKRGVAMAYRDKYGRTAKQAKNIPELKPYLTDLYEEIKDNNKDIIVEGSQGMYLDPHFTNDYPFCTSSHSTVGGALINGLPYNSIRSVYLTGKAYDTFVGNLKFQGEDPIFAKMAEVGIEVGTTTGRLRQCNWLNIDKLKKAVFVNGATHLVISKMDIFQQLDVWKVRFDSGEILDLKTEDGFKEYLCNIAAKLPTKPEVIFSYSKEKI